MRELLSFSLKHYPFVGFTTLSTVTYYVLYVLYYNTDKRDMFFF